MPLFSPQSRLFQWRNNSCKNNVDGLDDTNNINRNQDYNTNDVVFSSQCVACNRVGVPIFHSTSCDGAHPPERQALAGSSLLPAPDSQPVSILGSTRNPSSGPLGPVLDPRSKRIGVLNQVLLLARVLSLAADPLFFYGLSLSMQDGGVACFHVDKRVAASVTTIRTCADILHVGYLWVQLRLAYVSKESLVIGWGKLVWDARDIASHYVGSPKGFWLDIFVILPLPQALFWLLIRQMVREEKIHRAITILLLVILLQFIPKFCHIFHMMSRMRKVKGYVFGTHWWDFGLSILVLLLVSHVVGGCWYALATQRIVKCLQKQCERNAHCNFHLSCGSSTANANSLCLVPDGPFNYGIYWPILVAISSNSLANKMLYPILWGVLCLSTMGNVLTPSSDSVELLFSIFIVIFGLALFTFMVGYIQVFLSVALANKKQRQLRHQAIEWWMGRRQLPSALQKRIRHFEHQRWQLMAGQDDMNWIKDMPEGLRRDIKRHLCIDLIRKVIKPRYPNQILRIDHSSIPSAASAVFSDPEIMTFLDPVPLFHSLDDLILDNICDQVKMIIFSQKEKIIREGDPVSNMIFIIHGRVKRIQSFGKGTVATSVLEPGSFLGDELLSWSLRRPFIDRLPASSATFVCMKSVEAFSLDADQLRNITDYFRYRFIGKRLRQITRYHSSNWRTWGAVIIQLAWRRYRKRTRGSVIPGSVNGGVEDQLMKYAALFISLRRHDHLE